MVVNPLRHVFSLQVLKKFFCSDSLKPLGLFYAQKFLTWNVLKTLMAIREIDNEVRVSHSRFGHTEPTNYNSKACL